MKNKKTIIAIDPGKSGGIAVFVNDRIVSTVKMPATVPELETYLKTTLSQYENCIVFIEKVQAFAKDDDAPGKKFMINKMLANYTELLTVIKLNDVPFVEVYPISWQTTLGLKMKKDKRSKTERKNSYKTFAINCFPEVKKVTLATSDALCLVQFALTKFIKNESWINERIQNKRKNELNFDIEVNSGLTELEQKEYKRLRDLQSDHSRWFTQEEFERVNFLANKE